MWSTKLNIKFTNKLRLLYALIVIGLLFIISSSSLPNTKTIQSINLPGSNHIAPDSIKTDLKTLLKWFPGEYDNHQQVYREAVLNVEKEKRHRQTHHIFHAVQLDFLPGLQLYAQQSQHYDLNDIYRQRIYSFEIDDIENAIRLTIYTPKEPNRLKNAHLNPDTWKQLTKEDFFLKPGCEVFWKREGESFKGYLKENACNYYSERFQTQVYLNETLVLRKDALLLDDTAVDEKGKLVFGVADKGPTINLKELPCEESKK